MGGRKVTGIEDTPCRLDALVIGAGFAGLYMLHRLRGQGMSVRVLEAADGVGGTWYWNRYPGVRCDVESIDYSYSFDAELEQEWKWSERYATQPEILRYIEHVAERFDLLRDVELGTRVSSARWDEGDRRWRVETEAGARFETTYLITAVGCLSAVNTPAFPGLETFAGETYTTARWPHEGVDFTNRRVAVIGTGSTGIQAIPEIAKDAAHLYAFQRSPNFSVPARNRPLDPEFVETIKADYRARRQAAREAGWGVPSDRPLRPLEDFNARERVAVCEEGWRKGGAPGMLRAFADTMTNPEANRVVAEFVRAKIRNTVRDPAVAEKLIPTDHPLGAKRLCVDTDYYETYNRPNVTLVDVSTSPIEQITESGIRTREGFYEVDAIVFALGFDAITGALLALDIGGVGGETLAEHWKDGPRSYLGLAVAGFPNMLTVTGPGSPSVLGNVIVSIEQHVEWISDCLAYLRRHGLDRIEAQPTAEKDWVAHVADVASGTLFVSAKSWFMGANIAGKPRAFMPYAGGVPTYRKICDEVASRGYDGFTLGRADALAHSAA
ncbi:MAG TPA: NAD(P)/FAD-dependent oxidoreductase [Solirubrobacteraceae bacterium]|nr:NAD(P)/FAD-dependent oxidoreductase [Solirubrobacteraceae bacterium]